MTENRFMSSTLDSSSDARAAGPARSRRQYVSDYFQDELKILGIVSSPAFVRVLRREETADGQQQALGRHLGHLAGAE